MRRWRPPCIWGSLTTRLKITKADGTIDWIVLRPEFRQLLADLALGMIDGATFYDLDRLDRQPRDLEDLIDIVEYVKRR
ncbi:MULTISPECIES: recombinase family protein [unclassified Streptomyces]|uniref:recombinase family protein n=1 Tax=unclassified Streptomyces TaxID=2593676 RepID=UPI000C27D56B|nr:recombinase family protein [Streptomyces sp. CB02959]PJN34504.1 hypothetical protein CG747_39870 [Streptomyces sp. CB02959]